MLLSWQHMETGSSTLPSLALLKKPISQRESNQQSKIFTVKYQGHTRNTSRENGHHLLKNILFSWRIVNIVATKWVWKSDCALISQPSDITITGSSWLSGKVRHHYILLHFADEKENMLSMWSTLHQSYKMGHTSSTK